MRQGELHPVTLGIQGDVSFHTFYIFPAQKIIPSSRKHILSKHLLRFLLTGPGCCVFIPICRALVYLDRSHEKQQQQQQNQQKNAEIIFYTFRCL